MLHQSLEVCLELVVVRAVRARFDVQMHLQDLGRVKLAVDESIQLFRTVLTFHVCT